MTPLEMATSTEASGTGNSSAKPCLTLLIDQGYQVSSQYRIRDEFTGATLLRPGLLRLRQFIREGQLDAVAYYTADRLPGLDTA